MITEKSIRLLQQNQYTFYVDSRLTKTEMKNWIEQFFNVQVEGINSSRIRAKKKNKFNSHYKNKKKKNKNKNKKKE